MFAEHLAANSFETRAQQGGCARLKTVFGCGHKLPSPRVISDRAHRVIHRYMLARKEVVVHLDV